MEALLVVDIQPETVKPRRADALMDYWNHVIESFEPKYIAYIANLRPLARIPKGCPFAEGLNVVSDNIFFKRVPNAFTNAALSDWLDQIGADSVKIIGIDGNWCIKATALGALKKGFRVNVLADAVSSKNERVFREKTTPLLKEQGVEILALS